MSHFLWRLQQSNVNKRVVYVLYICSISIFVVWSQMIIIESLIQKKKQVHNTNKTRAHSLFETHGLLLSHKYILQQYADRPTDLQSCASI